ncbi:hypothetical protein P167DRAFT_479473 [Morchella conica CCBAS932]|uniref:Uncharacterized protein n=2 Tax=Morchella sect. Distantes TaxID=1051054 RepID=A0A3N4L3D2_9PEZI|nr:hypothetical protein P167DRAFT_479473 [Morchella conica CCBAS932]
MASTESAIPPAQTEAEMPTSPKAKGHRRGSSSVTDVYKPADLKELIGAEGELKLAKEISKLNWKINTHPSHLDDWKQLKQIPISSPKVKLLDVYFPMGLHVTARASAASALGVSVYDVLAAIHKQFKKKADDELEMPVLGNLEWGRSEDLTSKEHWPAVVLVAQKKEAPASSGKKKNN